MGYDPGRLTLLQGMAPHLGVEQKYNPDSAGFLQVRDRLGKSYGEGWRMNMIEMHYVKIPRELMEYIFKMTEK